MWYDYAIWLREDLLNQNSKQLLHGDVVSDIDFHKKIFGFGDADYLCKEKTIYVVESLNSTKVKDDSKRKEAEKND